LLETDGVRGFELGVIWPIDEIRRAEPDDAH